MEQIVTGCDNCPFYDSEFVRYHPGCRHISAPKIIGYYKGGHFYHFPDGKWTEDDVLEILRLYPLQETATLDYKGESIWIEGLEIEENENYKPITPDWCPIQKEPITIIKSNNGK
ncbi:MAG TPA: hypothetical protein VIY47_17090 [Ignavibacteriaceae bacterium]